MNETQLLADFKREFAVWQAQSVNRAPITVILTLVDAWILFSQLQLALRHPKNYGPSAKIARHLAEFLEHVGTRFELAAAGEPAGERLAAKADVLR